MSLSTGKDRGKRLPNRSPRIIDPGGLTPAWTYQPLQFPIPRSRPLALFPSTEPSAYICREHAASVHKTAVSAHIPLRQHVHVRSGGSAGQRRGPSSYSSTDDRSIHVRIPREVYRSIELITNATAVDRATWLRRALLDAVVSELQAAVPPVDAAEGSGRGDPLDAGHLSPQPPGARTEQR
jgi:hypothetical protein